MLESCQPAPSREAKQFIRRQRGHGGGTIRDGAPFDACRALGKGDFLEGPGGRLVAITGAGFAPDATVWAETFGRLVEAAHRVCTGAFSCRVARARWTETQAPIFS